MFYSNNLNLKNISYKKQKFASFANGINSDYDENLLSVKHSKCTYNFDFRDGALRDGIGISVPKFRWVADLQNITKELNFPSSPVRGIWVFTNWVEKLNLYNNYIVIYCYDNKVYYHELYGGTSEFYEINGLTLSSIPIVTTYKLNGVDTLIFVTEEDGMFTWSSSEGVRQIADAPKIRSMCIHYERLFVTVYGDRRAVWFSDDLDPTNFNISSSEGGFIEMVDDFGRLNKVVSFDGYLYVFRDYNIARLTAYAEQEQFYVSQLYVSNGKIYDSTISVCGNKIIYLASDGLYMFNGSSSSKIELSINSMFEGTNNQYASSGYSDGYYYLACTLNFKDDEIVGCESRSFNYNNALIKLNVQTGEFSLLRGFNIRNIYVLNDHLGSMVLITFQDEAVNKFGMLDNSGAYFGTPIHKVWKSADTDFGYPEKDKILKEIYLETKSDCSVVIETEKKKKTIKFKGKNGYQKAKPYVRGNKFSLTFVSDTTDTKISNPQVKVGVL